MMDENWRTIDFNLLVYGRVRLDKTMDGTNTRAISRVGSLLSLFPSIKRTEYNSC